MNSSPRRTEVAITIDTEFNIAGAFSDFPRFRPIAERVVDCPVDGRSEGLGFMLEIFARHGIRATFFVEALNYHYFGDGPMAGVCRRLQQAGQDIQLHIHPCWTAFDGDRLVVDKPDDSCAGRSLDSMTDLIRRGIDAFGRWGVARPVAMRTGNLVADRVVYRAMAALGIRVASNICVGVVRMPDPDLQLTCGRHRIDGVVEIPVTTFEDHRLMGRPHLRPLQVTACGWPEMEHVLWAARRGGLEQVVIITHPFEYVRTNSRRYDKIAVNRINQHRLRRLCAFLEEHDQDFASVAFGDRAPDWATAAPQDEMALRGTTLGMLARTAENGLLHRYWGA